MSEPIGVGDFVECVDARRYLRGVLVGGRDPSLQQGGVYRVVSCGTTAAPARPGIAIAGVTPRHPDHTGYWCVQRFRLIHRPSKSTFLQSLLQPVKETVK